MTDLQCDIALLKQRMDSGFEAVHAQFALTEEKLRCEFRDGLHTLEQRLGIKIDEESKRLEVRLSGEIQTLVVRMDRQDARMDRLDAKIDQLAKWMIGTQVTTMAFVVAIAVQLFLH